MNHHSIEGGGGLMLNAVETGPKGAPSILFVHGLSQTYDAWSGQLSSDLAEDLHLATFDLRGHGASEKPFEKEAYQNANLWAEDVRAVIERLGLTRPILVAWSFGGIVALDYLKQFEQEVAGLVLVGALTQNAVKSAFEHLGEAASHLKDMFSNDFSTQYKASKNFLALMTAAPLSNEAMSRQLAATMMTPPQVRFNLGSRKVDHTDTLQSLELPILCIHGDKDRVILPSSSQHTLTHTVNATLELYKGIGHAPFLESPERFNNDLRAFMARVNKV